MMHFVTRTILCALLPVAAFAASPEPLHRSASAGNSLPLPLGHVLILTLDDTPRTVEIAQAWAAELKNQGLPLVTVAPAGWIQPAGTPPPDAVATVATPDDAGTVVRAVRYDYFDYRFMESGRGPRPGHTCYQLLTRDQESPEMAFGVNGPPIPEELAAMLIPEFSGPVLIDWPEEIPFELLYSAAGPGFSSETLYRLDAPPERFDAMIEEATMVLYALDDDGSTPVYFFLNNDGLVGGPGGFADELKLRILHPVEKFDVALNELEKRGLLRHYLKTLYRAMPSDMLERLADSAAFRTAATPEQLLLAIDRLAPARQRPLLELAWARRGEATFEELLLMLEHDAKLGGVLPPDAAAALRGEEVPADAVRFDLPLTAGDYTVRYYSQGGRRLYVAAMLLPDGKARVCASGGNTLRSACELEPGWQMSVDRCSYRFTAYDEQPIIEVELFERMSR